MASAKEGTSNELMLLPAPSCATIVIAFGPKSREAAVGSAEQRHAQRKMLRVREGKSTDEGGATSMSLPFALPLVVSIGGGAGGGDVHLDLRLSGEVAEVVVVAADESRECQAPGVRVGAGEGEGERGRESVDEFEFEWVELEEEEEKRVGVMVASVA